ncbi:hypothetical protein ACJMK2_022408 [Sinanodonta woodiana]|uniref:BZIP domain-containing protein n=1 Tax=Sinanodonta woodiana TaxID=1069815 RepID=A0ABD3TK66_SINWO
MIKQYFFDGLVQIAIVLSLLRIDINNLNNNYVNYPEVQEIILGQTAAITQSNFHNLINPYDPEPEIYRKNIDTDLSASHILRDLRSIRHLSQYLRPETDITTFLIVGGSSFHLNTGADAESSSPGVGGNHVEPSQTVSNPTVNNAIVNNSSTENATLENLTNSESLLELSSPAELGSNPTTEDLDLIEVLWRQDIDLGVGKEVFDVNLRRQLEREREIELAKERQKQKELELAQAKQDEQRRQQQQRWLSDNFTQDGETGEWVPLGRRVPPPPPAPDLMTNGQIQNFLSYDYEQLLNEDLPQPDPSSGYPSMSHQQSPVNHHIPQQTSPPQYSQRQHQGSQQNVPNPQTIYNNQGYQTHQVVPQYNDSHMQQGYNAQMNSYNNTSMTQMSPQQRYGRQESFEQTWQDLVNLLELPLQNNSQMVNQSQRMTNTSGHLFNGHMIMNRLNTTAVSTSNPVMMPSSTDNTSSVLIQNATLPTPPAVSDNFTGFNNTEMMSPVHSSGMLSPSRQNNTMSSQPGQNYNSSVPNTSGMTPIEWDSSNMLFPNISGSINQTESLEDVDELLPELITEDDLDGINLAEMGINDTVISLSPPIKKHSDEASSDSAMSIGSPEQDTFSESTGSPFDGLEGATGGHDYDSSPGSSKTSKYDPDDYSFSHSCSYSHSENGHSNYSSSFNDTGYGSQGSPADTNHIHHNHSYPLQPGADPKDVKKQIGNDKPKHKGPHCRDHKRVVEMKIPFTVDQIVNLPVEEFNDIMSHHKFNEQQIQLIRDIRRRGKNKVAAHNCRKRKMDIIYTLGDEMQKLESDRDRLIQERFMIDKETRELKEKFGALYQEIFHSLRDEHGHPYDPARFSLQQSSDGDVFLVPRNFTSVPENHDDKNKKRKNDKK